MKHLAQIALVMAALVLLGGLALGQSRSRAKPKSRPPVRPNPTPTESPVTPAPAKRPVVINLKQGDPVSGNFIRADADTLLIDVQSGRLSIKLSDVVSLVFAAEEGAAGQVTDETVNKPSASAVNASAAREALKALRKLAAAAEIRLPYAQYGSLLIEVRANVEEALTRLEPSALRSEIEAALEAYTDAGQAWSLMQVTGALPLANEPGPTLMKKYKIKPSHNAVGQADHLRREIVLSAIYAAAHAHLDQAAELLGAAPSR